MRFEKNRSSLVVPEAFLLVLGQCVRGLSDLNSYEQGCRLI